MDLLPIGSAGFLKSNLAEKEIICCKFTQKLGKTNA